MVYHGPEYKAVWHISYVGIEEELAKWDRAQRIRGFFCSLVMYFRLPQIAYRRR